MPRLVMVIRHAEKPEPGILGIQEDGAPDKKSLTPRGWQRAGALVALFGAEAPRRPFARPTHLFAAGPDDQDPSQRPRETLTPLAKKLGLRVRDHFDKDRLADALAEVVGLDDAAVVLVSWEHKTLAKYLSEGRLTPPIAIANRVPDRWPDGRFDVVWMFERTSPTTYAFTAEPQLVLAGDDAATF
jgi:broad specificity phosphatase PhoE